MALFVDLVALSNGLHGSVQMDSVALFSWIGWLRHHGILTLASKKYLKTILINNIDSTITYKTICQKLKSPLDTNILRIKPHIKRNNAQLLEYAS